MKIRTRKINYNHKTEYAVRIRRGKYNNLFVASFYLDVYNKNGAIKDMLDIRNIFVLKSFDNIYISFLMLFLRIFYK